ncbi:MAG: TRAP transporter small permease subunit, partial [Blautia sp.]|nr:TRAP transporter small permease subunit [Blautia sp.]
MKRESTLKKVILNLDIAVAAIVLIVLIVLTFAGVIMRYIVGKPFTWLEEVQLFCMVWIVFSAAGAAYRTGNHVAIEMVVEMFPKSVQKVIEYV